MKRQNKVVSLLAVMMMLTPLGAVAGTIYNINLTVGAGSVSGMLETDGTTGMIATTNVMSWTFDLCDGIDCATISSTTGGNFSTTGALPLIAAGSTLIFDPAAWGPFVATVQMVFFENLAPSTLSSSVDWWQLAIYGNPLFYPVGPVWAQFDHNYMPHVIGECGGLIQVDDWCIGDFFEEIGVSPMVIGSAVPVPAAGWLFGSALLGIAGLKRKRKG